MKALYFTLLAAFVTAFGASAASASVVIYSNYSSDPNSTIYPYTANPNGYQLQWSESLYATPTVRYWFGLGVAVPFTVTTGYDLPLLSISMAIFKYPNGTSVDGQGDKIAVNHDNLIVNVVKSSGGLPDTSPSGLVASFPANPAIAENGYTFVTLDATTNPILQTGATYWVTAEPAMNTTNTSQDTFEAWIANDGNQLGNYTFNEAAPGFRGWVGWGNYMGGPTFPLPSLDVLGASPVPEPAALALLGPALACLGLARRGANRRRR